MTGMDDLVTWLRAQLADDERKIAAMEREEGRVQTAPIFQGHPPNWLAGVDIFVSSKRWRDEVDVKRRILDRYADALARQGDWEESQIAAHICAEEYEGWIIPALAAPYAGRAGWREEWRA
jgi:hypothetical protein